ncbi:restriction endonuclease subunit S [Anaerovibrio lipolyticus]|uniref:restriction endonuclease subunit S n=1 Tax=Anaerovibrio lipolyticus TaxID=82374 RepID=UPI0026EEE102|nr:restriction endonuclease subunit S [Anaerovibrio lipolyticus]MBE6106415.1 restriction endonuclease subunit S [Anaerovibrio lipolyticus]
MGLNKIRLGKYIELYSERCNIPNLSNEEVSGINKYKEFFEPSNQVGSDTSKYKIVPPGYFACNLMHVGRDVVLPIAYNHSGENKIVSPAYHVFKFCDNEELVSEYFFLYLKSPERDRYFWFNTDGSVRDGMNRDDFINVEIELPSLKIQQKYVEVYNALLTNQHLCEQGLKDLKLSCDAFFYNRKRNDYVELENVIEKTDKINTNNQYGILDVKGMTITKKIIDTKANMIGTDLSNYIVVGPHEFVYNPRTHGKKIGLGYNNSDKEFLISWNNIAFRVKKTETEKILPEYLFYLFRRDEWDREACFNSWGSSTEVLSWGSLCDMRIPCIHIDDQRIIVKLDSVYNMKSEINEKLKAQIKDICPILIKGSIEEAKKEV